MFLKCIGNINDAIKPSELLYWKAQGKSRFQSCKALKELPAPTPDLINEYKKAPKNE